MKDFIVAIKLFEKQYRLICLVCYNVCKISLNSETTVGKMHGHFVSSIIFNSNLCHTIPINPIVQIISLASSTYQLLIEIYTSFNYQARLGRDQTFFQQLFHIHSFVKIN